jgi:tyrosyl-tRNA synthetase
MNFKSDFLREFHERGFFSQITHEKELDSLMANEKITAYIGFDCTAKSLHAGSLIQIMILRLLQKHGHKPLVLLGGGTTKIGDPSGKDEARQVLNNENILENLTGIKKTLEKFITFGGGASNAILVNNDDWLKQLNYIDFLREIGRHFSINRMLSFDSVKLRLEREQPLSFLEFNYMILQAYDFYELNHKYNCRLQIGGSDQWGNIVNGVELTRRIAASKRHDFNSDNSGSPYLGGASGRVSAAMGVHNENHNVFGLTSPLLTTSDGKKMGKTANGAIWLDENMLSAFDYFQYFRNTTDADVGKFLRLFTDLEIAEIEKLEKLQDKETNKAKEILAFEATRICHGENKANEVLQKAREIFISKNSEAFEELNANLNEKLIDVIFASNAFESKGAIKKLIEGKAVKINDETILDIHQILEKLGEFELKIGKKKFFKLIVK